MYPPKCTKRPTVWSKYYGRNLVIDSPPLCASAYLCILTSCISHNYPAMPSHFNNQENQDPNHTLDGSHSPMNLSEQEQLKHALQSLEQIRKEKKKLKKVSVHYTTKFHALESSLTHVTRQSVLPMINWPSSDSNSKSKPPKLNSSKLISSKLLLRTVMMTVTRSQIGRPRNLGTT